MSRLKTLTADDIARPRLVIRAAGHTDNGKTTFALTAPKPMVFLDIDKGAKEGPIDTFLRGEMVDPITGAAFGMEGFQHGVFSLDEEDLKKAFEEFEAAWYQGCDDPSVRTIVSDTWSEFRKLGKLGLLGRGQVPPIAYQTLNERMAAMADHLMNTRGKNAVLLCRLKKVYVQSRDPATGKPSNKVTDSFWNGEWEPDGGDDLGYTVHADLRMEREYGELVGPDGKVVKESGRAVMEDRPTGAFYFRVQKCRQRSALDGQIFKQPMNTFTDFAMSVFPNTTVEDWR